MSKFKVASRCEEIFGDYKMIWRGNEELAQEVVSRLDGTLMSESEQKMFIYTWFYNIEKN